MRDIIKLVSTAGTGYFYTTTRNKRITTESKNVVNGKLQLMKFDPKVRKHVIFKEEKIK